MPGPLIQQVTQRIFERTGVEDLAGHLSDRYGIDVAEVARLDAGVFRVDRRDGPPWVARLFPAARPLDHVKGDADVLRFLEAQAFPSERLARPDPVSSMHGQGVLVTEHVAGTAARGDLATLEALGDILGRLLTLHAGDSAPSRPAGSLHHWSVEGGGPAADIKAALAFLDDAEPGIEEEQRTQLQQFRQQVAAADGLDGLPEALIHPDYYFANTIATPDGSFVLVDWTGAGVGPRIAPIGFLLWQAMVRNPDAKIPDSIDAIVAGLRHHVTLEPEELERLSAAMTRPALIFDCFQLCLGRMSVAQALQGIAAREDIGNRIVERARQSLEV